MILNIVKRTRITSKEFVPNFKCTLQRLKSDENECIFDINIKRITEIFSAKYFDVKKHI